MDALDQIIEKTREHYQSQESKQSKIERIKILAKMKETKGQAIIELYQFFLTDEKFITLEGDEDIYYYNNGIYLENGASHIRRRIKELLGELDSSHFVEEVISHIKRATMKRLEEVEPPKNLLVLENGILNTETLELQPHNSDYLFLSKLPIIYDITKQATLFEKFLNDVVSEEDKNIIQEIFGYCLLRSHFIHKAFMFIGGGRNGKSTCLHVLKSMLGEKNIGALSIQAISNNDFALGNLYQKLANIYADLPSGEILETDKFKMITGEDFISCDRKNKTMIHFVNYAKLVFSCNQIPYTKDDSHAFFSRWIIINFSKIFNDNDPNTDKKLKQKLTTQDELSGVLNFALIGLKRLLENTQFSYTKSSEEVKIEYLRKSDNIDAFWNECVETEEWSRIAKDVLYEIYCDYCEVYKTPPHSEDFLSKRLKSPKGKYKLRDGRLSKEPRPRVWIGIKFNDSFMPEVDNFGNKQWLEYLDVQEYIKVVQDVQSPLYSGIYKHKSKYGDRKDVGQDGQMDKIEQKSDENQPVVEERIE